MPLLLTNADCVVCGELDGVQLLNGECWCVGCLEEVEVEQLSRCLALLGGLEEE